MFATCPTAGESHFLPAGVYRILRDDGEKNPNPWQLTRTNSVQTSWQMKAPLLCFDCEQRLCKHGEAWVLAHCLKKDGAFPLASILAGRSPALASDETTTRIYHAFGIPEINVNAISYFAASMFWRGSIHPWNEDGTYPVSLGPSQSLFYQLPGQRSWPVLEIDRWGGQSNPWIKPVQGSSLDLFLATSKQPLIDGQGYPYMAPASSPIGGVVKNCNGKSPSLSMP
jgi:hypothetical protein